MIETIQQAVKPHDKYQLEIKLDYELHPTKQTRYQVSTYIFIPQSLGVNDYSYSKADFYRDMQNYIRLKTPTCILRDFTDSPTSPLAIVGEVLAQPHWATQQAYKTRLIDSFKLVRAMLKSSLREHFNLIQQRISEASPKTELNLIIGNLIEEFLVESQKIIAKHRSFYSDFNLPNVDPEVFMAYKLTDEAVSLLIEKYSIKMFQVVETHLPSDERCDFKQKIDALVTAETKYRKSLGYRSILKKGKANEEYVFRTSVLKKYTSSVLFLSTAIRREGAGLEQILFAIAAGMSMIFATIVAFYFSIDTATSLFRFSWLWSWAICSKIASKKPGAACLPSTYTMCCMIDGLSSERWMVSTNWGFCEKRCPLFQRKTFLLKLLRLEIGIILPRWITTAWVNRSFAIPKISYYIPKPLKRFWATCRTLPASTILCAMILEPISGKWPSRSRKSITSTTANSKRRCVIKFIV
jgi:hypothetical protein